MEDGPTRATPDNFTQVVSRRLRMILLNKLNDLKAAKASVAEESLSSFFKFATQCVREGILWDQDILTLFEDLYESCPE